MISQRRTLRSLALHVAAATSLVAVAQGHASNSAAVQPAPFLEHAADEVADPTADAPIADYQKQLLDLAFEAVSKMPLHPHIKNRSRAQEAVVVTCYEMEQPQLALRFVEEIKNWRKGMGLADYALYCVNRGVTDGVEKYLIEARQIAKADAEQPSAQEWRAQRILDKIELVRGIAEQKKSGKEGGVYDDPKDFKIYVDSLEAALEGYVFEDALNAMGDAAKLYADYYEDEKRRERIQGLIVSAREKIPATARLDALFSAAQTAFEHGDRENATQLTDLLKSIFDDIVLSAEVDVAMRARIAPLYHMAGNKEKAHAMVADALDAYETKRALIMNIDRAGLLREVAAAFVKMDEGGTALDMYKRAVEAGMENPNSRPRSTDFAETCCAMAKHEIEPDEALWKRLREINGKLQAPW